MNEWETKGLKWIVRETGFAASQIRFRNNCSPDFLTPDGQGFEVKRRTWANIFLWPRQFDQLKAISKCTIIVFSGGDEPDAIIPVSQLPYGSSEWGKIHIRFLSRCPGSTWTRTRTEYFADIRAAAIKRNRYKQQKAS